MIHAYIYLIEQQILKITLTVSRINNTPTDTLKAITLLLWIDESEGVEKLLLLLKINFYKCLY